MNRSWRAIKNVSMDNLLAFLGWMKKPAFFNFIRMARDNLPHSVRGKITVEVWESINATWLE